MSFYEAHNLITTPMKTFYCYQRCLIKKLIKMLFAVYYLLLLSSFAFKTLLIRVITLQIDIKNALACNKLV